MVRDDAIDLYSLVQLLIKLASVPANVNYVEFKHAEREGTREVFGEYLVDKIKTLEIHDN